MTNFIEQLNQILIDLRESGEVSSLDWPTDAPFSALEMGLVEHSKIITLPDQLELIDLDYIENKLPSTRCKKFEAIGSTNSEMLKASHTEDINDLLYLAEYQHSGRGRHGRTWVSPYARNLSISYGLETDLPFASLGCLSLVIGLSVADSLRSIGLDMVKLKWPNDILVDDKKLGGILTELSDKGSFRAVVVGLGLNIDISRKEQTKIDQPLVDCRGLGIKLSRSHLISIIVTSMRSYLDKFLERGFKPMKEKYEEFLVYRDQVCRLQVRGRVVAEGIVRGVNDKGELEVYENEGLRSYNVGEISLRPADHSIRP